MGFLGLESKFIVPLARPSGAMLCIAMKLASDPNNPIPVAAFPPPIGLELWLNTFVLAK